MTTCRFTAIVLALGVAAPALAQPPSPRATHASTWSAHRWIESWQERQGPEQTEKIVKTFKVGAAGSLDVWAISGDVIVDEAGGDTITVVALKRVRSRTPEEAKKQLANTNVLMSQTGGRVEVKVDYVGRENHASVDFTVTAPAGTAVNARSISGDVRVKGIKGEVRVESVSGDVSALATPSLASIKTVSGDLELSGVTGQDTLAASTISGNLVLKSIKARVVSAESVSGEMSLTDVACERATVKSVSGSVEYLGPLAKGGRYEMKSHSGDIRVTLSEDAGFELNAKSFSGAVRSDLPITVGGEQKQDRPDRPDRPGRPGRPGQGLSGKHGDGSALLLLGTFSGDIVVAKK